RRALDYSLRAVINATGVILHTNLGRAPLAEEAVAHIRATVSSYSNLEFEVDAGARGKRDVHVERLLRGLLDGAISAGPAGTRPRGTPEADVATSSASTIVVNNNAAAVLLALNP